MGRINLIIFFIILSFDVFQVYIMIKTGSTFCFQTQAGAEGDRNQIPKGTGRSLKKKFITVHGYTHCK